MPAQCYHFLQNAMVYDVDVTQFSVSHSAYLPSRGHPFHQIGQTAKYPKDYTEYEFGHNFVDYVLNSIKLEKD